MTRLFILPLVTLMWSLCLPLLAQPIAAATPIAGTLIVRLAPDYRIERVLSLLHRHKQLATWQLGRHLGAQHYLLTQAQGEPTEAAALHSLQHLPGVQAVQYDYYVQSRNSPNDPLYAQQESLDKIALAGVWDVTTGGTTATGDTIVVAVLDSGFDLNHTDMVANLWHNRAEIPQDGIDNDNNGYIDDTRGWNFVNDSPQHNRSQHGQSVTGIIGATGNNGRGVTGINWNIKLMLLGIERVSEIVEAYEYVITQRQRYNESGGQQGALVVVTNASFGQEGVYCAQQPVWEAMYDQLGAVGVLTAASAANRSWDVERNGDMPTTCTSDFLIGVTGSTINDELDPSVAYGATSIDLAAPSENAYTTRLDDQFGTFGGTSAAAPHVAGVIALLYSLPCTSLADNVLDNPVQTALAVRQAILDGADALPSFLNRTLTGGRLNALRSMEVIQSACGTSSGPLALLSVYPNPVETRLNVAFETPDFVPYRLRVYDALGRLVRDQVVMPPRFGEKVTFVQAASLARGIYWLELSGPGGRVVQKFVRR